MSWQPLINDLDDGPMTEALGHCSIVSCFVQFSPLRERTQQQIAGSVQRRPSAVIFDVTISSISAFG
jgi:hypothetical protein